MALIWLIALITNLAFFHRWSTAEVEAQHHVLGLWVIVVPVIGAIIIGLMARYGSEKIRGHGIPEALEAILLGRSLISPKVAILKPVSSAISIGTGGPFGAEGPIIMTGGAFGSLFAQFFHLTAGERKTLLVAGAAGGMAAVFATPVAAVLLAVELLLFEWKPRSFIPVAVAAIVASIARVPLLGGGPLFAVTPHGHGALRHRSAHATFDPHRKTFTPRPAHRARILGRCFRGVARGGRDGQQRANRARVHDRRRDGRPCGAR